MTKKVIALVDVWWGTHAVNTIEREYINGEIELVQLIERLRAAEIIFNIMSDTSAKAGNIEVSQKAAAEVSTIQKMIRMFEKLRDAE